MQLPLPWIMNQERFSSKGRWGWGSSAECISLESTEGVFGYSSFLGVDELSF